MKKEVSVAVFIGLLIGGIIIGGIYRAKVALDSHRSSATPTPRASASPSASGVSDALPLKITSPLDNSVMTDPTTELSGQTKPGTYVTILTEKNEFIIVPDDSGKFTQKITLVKGANALTITTYTATGDKTEVKLNLVYTTADL